MHPTERTARVAGALYLLNGVTFFSIMYVPSRLIVSGNAAATASNILAHEVLFRVSIVSELFCAAEFIFLVRALHRLLNGVDKRHASLMVTLGLIPLPIMFLNVLNEIAALALFRGAWFPVGIRQTTAGRLGNVVSPAAWQRNRHRRDPLGSFFHSLRSPGDEIGFPSPHLGHLLIAASIGYLADSLTSLLLPSYGDLVNRFAGILTWAGELSIMAWLLIKGAKVPGLAAAAPCRALIAHAEKSAQVETGERASATDGQQ